jgi:hypothetical protein
MFLCLRVLRKRMVLRKTMLLMLCRIAQDDVLVSYCSGNPCMLAHGAQVCIETSCFNKDT